MKQYIRSDRGGNGDIGITQIYKMYLNLVDDYDGGKMNALAPAWIKKTKPLTIFKRIAEKDQTAVQDCVNSYGNFIWALARKYTSSIEEEEAAAQEIFIDIWRYAERVDKTQSAENMLIALIARRRLVKHLE